MILAEENIAVIHIFRKLEPFAKSGNSSSSSSHRPICRYMDIVHSSTASSIVVDTVLSNMFQKGWVGTDDVEFYLTIYPKKLTPSEEGVILTE